jgi:hypothetical protein
MVMVVIWQGDFHSWIKKTFNVVEFLLHSQPPCRIIRITADYFLLPYKRLLTAVHPAVHHGCIMKKTKGMNSRDGAAAKRHEECKGEKGEEDEKTTGNPVPITDR